MHLCDDCTLDCLILTVRECFYLKGGQASGAVGDYRQNIDMLFTFTWLVNNLRYRDICSSHDTVSYAISGYIITSVVISSIFIIIIIISVLLNARKTKKLCWVSIS